MSTNGDIDTIGLPELLDFNLDELDDAEYNIPPVDKPPTLESILNDDDSSLISEEELLNYLPQELLPVAIEDSIETGSVSSVGSRGGHSPAYKKVSPPECILRQTILRAVSSQLQTSFDVMNAGYPSVMHVTGVIAIGTSHGVIFCFDTNQRLRWTHDKKREREQGSVSCISVNFEATRILAGFSRGLILMFDAQDGKVLRVIEPDEHTPSTAVVHLKFTDLVSLALLCDSGGSVFEINLKRVLGVRSSEVRCVFSGSRGEVLAVEPLMLDKLASHPLSSFVIVAMATLSKVLLVSLRPDIRLLFTFSMSGSPLSLPLLSWEFVVIQIADSSRVMDPVLAFARDQTIHFFQVNLEGSGRIAVHILQTMSVEYSLLSCHWLTSRTMAVLDSTETLHLLDVRTKQELETLDMSNVALVYNSSAFKGLATGGNVSKAMALAGQRACYNSVQRFGSQLLLLGIKSVHNLSIRCWTERINNLVHQNRFSEALQLAMDFYEDRGKAVLGLRGPKPQRQKLVRDKLLDTLNKFVDKLNDCSDCLDYKEAIPIAIDYCLDLDQKELLFNVLWPGLPLDVIGYFLDSIESSILSSKIEEVPPEVMQKLVLHLQSHERWTALEECVQRVQVTCLDIEQVILICKEQKLYSALISIWNRAMGDFISPLTELIPLLKTHIQDGSVTSEGRKLGNILIVYIATCLGGHEGRSGVLKGDKAEHARSQVLRALCTQHSQNADDSEHLCPYMRTLLEFDTREFLNALAIAFSDSALTLQRQRLVDILIQVMTEGSAFKCTQVAWLLCVLSSGSVGRGLRIDPQLTETVVTRLVTEEEVPHNEREEALLRLVSEGAVGSFGAARLLSMSKIGHFYQVAAILHERNGDHGEVMKCYLLDSSRRKHVFSYLEQTPHKGLISQTLPEVIQDLIEIDATRTGRTLTRHYPQVICQVIHSVCNLNLFNFLRGIFEESNLDSELMTKYVCLMCEYEPEKALQTVLNHDNIELDTAIKASKQFGLDEVTAVLLERSGDYQGAFNVLLARLENYITQGLNVDRQTEELVNLAQRGSAVLESKTSWLPLLMCLLKLNCHDLLQRVLSNADLNLVPELHLLMQVTKGTLGDLRSLIMGLFVKCRDQRRMLEASRKLHMLDLHDQLELALKEVKHGLLAPSSCKICHNGFSDRLFLFRCGHGYHSECIHPYLKCLVCQKPEDSSAPTPTQ